MTDAELLSWWPDLGQVVIELRRLNHPAEADRLLDAVAAGATSTEILGSVGLIFLRAGNLRSELTRQNKASWDRVMADINYAYPPNFRFNHWLARFDRNLEWPRSILGWLIALAWVAGLLLVMLLLVRGIL
jgi:hypothetical protein